MHLEIWRVRENIKEKDFNVLEDVEERVYHLRKHVLMEQPLWLGKMERSGQTQDVINVTNRDTL